MTAIVEHEITNLEEKLVKAKTNLKGLNNEIRRIIGRPVEDERDR